MNLAKYLIILFLSGLGRFTYGQNPLVLDLDRPYFLTKVTTLPTQIGSGRCAVIFSVPEETRRYTFYGKTEKLVGEVHRSLLKMKVDAILYVQKGDFLSGPESHLKYLEIFQQRNIENLLFVNQSVREDSTLSYSLCVTPFNNSDPLLKPMQEAWYESSVDLNTLFLRMGRQLLRQENISRTNFLIPGIPEILEDPELFTGLRLENFPGQLRRATLGVVKFQKIAASQSEDPAVLQAIEAYNREVDQKNDELVNLLQRYPFRYELIDYVPEEELYREGYQYVLLSLQSSGEFIQQLLKSPTSGNETVYISIIPVPGTDRDDLKRIPARALVTKYYIKQTVSSDVHVGKEWDADTSWQAALTNFLLHLEEYMTR